MAFIRFQAFRFYLGTFCAAPSFYGIFLRYVTKNSNKNKILYKVQFYDRILTTPFHCTAAKEATNIQVQSDKGEE